MSTAAEARTACIFGREHGGGGEDGMYFIFGKAGEFCFLAAARWRLNGIDDEIYERADVRYTSKIVTASTLVNSS